MAGRSHLPVLGLLVVGCWLNGCHGEATTPLPAPRAIGLADRFYDVAAIDADRAVVVGYGGKILLTTDGGYTWTLPASGTDRALYSVDFVDGLNGWVSGQDGILLRTTDGGQSWTRLPSPTAVYMFAIDFLDLQHGWAVGDRSLMLETHDGGATWTVRKVSPVGSEAAAEDIASAEPVLYDVHFLTRDVGWIVGEFGKILHTTDGGTTWRAQQESLLGGEIVDVLDIPTFFGARFPSEREGVAAGLDGKIARTTDSGASWKFDPMRLEYPIADPLFQPFLAPDGSGWAVGAAGEVVRLSAPGQAWERYRLGMEVATWLRAMDWSDAENGWIVGGFGLILHTKDGGNTWVPAIA